MEEKEEEKREKGKSGFGKSPFCFCLTVSLPLPFFSLHPPHHHTTTCSPHTIQHDALVHTITCKQGRVLCCLFLGVDSKTHTASSTPLTPSLDITQHTPTNPNTDTAHGACNNEMTIVNEKGIEQKRGKVGQHSSTKTLIEVATTQ